MSLNLPGRKLHALTSYAALRACSLVVRAVARNKTRVSTHEVLVSLLISTHALPPFSYRVPRHLSKDVRIGSAVVVPLSGYSQLGFVIETDGMGEMATEEVRALLPQLSLQPDIVELCRWCAQSAAIPLAAALRAALPPGVKTGQYRISNPDSGWPWRRDSFVSGTALRRSLGGEGLRRAEFAGRVVFAPMLPARRDVQWAMLGNNADPPPRRAYRQRELLNELEKHDSGVPVSDLLRDTGVSRTILRALVERGTVRIEDRAEPLPISEAHGILAYGANSFREVEKAAVRGGAWLWRLPASEQARAVAALVGRCTRGGEQALILAPEISEVERISRELLTLLPEGHRVATYHSGIGAVRAGIHRAARRGEVGVVVGTRTASLLPLRRPGLICVLDESNEAHRAEPGYEGIPIHAREIACERGRLQDVPTVFLASVPSLRLYARKPALDELAPVPTRQRPAIRVVDMRGSGASLSSTLIDFCRESVEAGNKTAVVLDRLGYARVVSCSRCGAARTCPDCDLPLAYHRRFRSLICNRCGRRETASESCESCGAKRLVPTGLATERVRAELSDALGCEVGLLTADACEREDSTIVVGTSRRVFEEGWDALILPDVDARLSGSGVGAVEGAFRLLYRAVESARERLLIQTRFPEHYALRAALRQDYPTFAATELGRRKSLGYPPYTHLAKLMLTGLGKDVRRAVEFGLRPSLNPEVEASELLPSPDGPDVWQVVLRARESEPLVRAGTDVARMAAKGREFRKIKVRVEIEPEEV